MDNQVVNNDKENISPAVNVPEVETPKIYTVESEPRDSRLFLAFH